VKLPERIADQIYNVLYDSSDSLAITLDRMDSRDRGRMFDKLVTVIHAELTAAHAVVLVPATNVEAK